MHDVIFKVVVFGNEGVGTPILLKSTTSDYIYDMTLTIGVDFWVKKKTKGIDLREKILEINGITVKLVIWRLSGEKRFRYVIPTNVKGANGGIFVYDVTNYSTIDHIDDWLRVIKKKIDDLFPIIVVGNIPDLSKKREVSSDEAIEIAKARGLDGFIECSPKTGENVEEMFETLVRIMLQRSEKNNITQLKYKIKTKEGQLKSIFRLLSEDETKVVNKDRKIENLKKELEKLNSELMKAEKEFEKLESNLKDFYISKVK